MSYLTTGLPATLAIEWVSPVQEDEFAEYRDEDFLIKLGLDLQQYPLQQFWPKRGAQWDALARTDSGDVFLVEAKANIPEVISPGTAASAQSRDLIERSLEETKNRLGVNPDIPWSGKLYQYTNRIAHLYLLRILNDIPAWLVFVYFVGDEDTNGPKSVAEWKSAISVVKGELGLKRHVLSKYVIDIFVDVRDLGSEEANALSLREPQVKAAQESTGGAS